MSQLEGTIQFAYELTAASGPALEPDDFSELSAWRCILHDLNLLGQSKDRYAGYAYGNLSVRPVDEDEFVITASQTSGEPTLCPEHLVTVTHYNLERFWVDATGAVPPSSESITHGMIYAADLRFRCVFHAHSPVIWRNRAALRLPETAADVTYGSQAMIVAVEALMQDHQSRPLTFATAGHEDGIFACGYSPRESGVMLVNYLAKALAIEHAGDTGEP